jgi:hypothetical protein
MGIDPSQPFSGTAAEGQRSRSTRSRFRSSITPRRRPVPPASLSIQ